MKFKLENIGPLKSADFEIGNLTVICGKNNTGKTYAAYTAGLFVKFFLENLTFDVSSFAEVLVKNGKLEIGKQQILKVVRKAIKDFEPFYVENMPKLFQANKSFFEKSKVTFDSDCISIDKKFKSSVFKRKGKFQIEFNVNKDVVFAELVELDVESSTNAHQVAAILRRMFVSVVDFPAQCEILSTERVGIAQLYKELNPALHAAMEHVDDSNIESLSDEDRLKHIINFFPRVIFENITRMNMISEFQNLESTFADENSSVIDYIGDILNGNYVLEDGVPYFSTKSGRFRFNMASSSVRSLFLLDHFVKHVAKTKSVLIIDEPELNLHPDAQRILARLLSTLANRGIKVIISTHSDYILKEINILMALHSLEDSGEVIKKKYNYTDHEIIDHRNVKVYIAENGSLNEVETGLFGAEVRSFDDSIHKMNEIYNAIALVM